MYRSELTDFVLKKINLNVFILLLKFPLLNHLSEIIRREFEDSTVITVAHRLDTIIDSDKIMVMDAGEIAEFDHPKALLLVPKFFQLKNSFTIN